MPKVARRLNHLATGIRLQLDFLGLLIGWQWFRLKVNRKKRNKIDTPFCSWVQCNEEKFVDGSEGTEDFLFDLNQ